MYRESVDFETALENKSERDRVKQNYALGRWNSSYPLCLLLVFPSNKGSAIRTEQERQHEENSLFLKHTS